MEQPHIIVNITDDFKDDAVDKMTLEIKSKGLNLSVNRVPNEAMMALELTIPGLIAIYIAQSYFGGFLSEFGKDHYNKLKKWLKATAINSRQINVITYTASQSTKKIDRSNTQSKAFSLHLKTKDNRQIKLLFDLNLSDNVWEKSIDKMINSILDNYENYPNDDLTKEITKLNTHRPNIYALINPDTSEWEYYDHMTLITRNR